MFTQNKKTSLVTFLLNKKSAYLANLVCLNRIQKMIICIHVNITTEPTFILNKEKYNNANELFYTRNGYAYNNGSSEFIAVMNDSNEDLKRKSEVINPIDTFPRLNKTEWQLWCRIRRIIFQYEMAATASNISFLFT
jgi:hypothetical protein